MSLPDTTHALTVNPDADPSGPLNERLRLTERPVPALARGQALVRIDAAPVNPSDALFVRGRYGITPQPGAVPGFEGCGTVLAAQAGPYGRWLTGKRVALGGQGGNGTWAAHVVTSVGACLPVARDLAVADAATLIVNPMTVIGLMARAKRHKAPAIVLTAAGSSVGRGVLALARRDGVPAIALVRREATAASLRESGAEHVLVTTADGFTAHFRDLAQRLNATVLLDAVSGPLTADLLNAMPDGARAVVYGLLHDDPDYPGRGHYPANGLIFRRQAVEGYWLSDDFKGLGVLRLLTRARRAQRLFKDGVLTTQVAERASLDGLPAAIERYERAMGAGKVLLTPHTADRG